MHEPEHHDHDHLSPLELRVRALETVLTKVGPRNGAQVIARAWCDREFRRRLCTLCSCYPWPVLGLPPTWYKSAPYRARAVKDPRGVLSEFGVQLPESVRIRIWDSTAEVRYLVLPRRPAGTEHLSESQLAELVTRDSMIGTGLPLAPGGAPASRTSA
jgi:nitrile hydratase subunit alpha